jgi:NAD(P)-dependent dehydrogenase (short-subunit alcohol dehydrogenase family)
MVAMQLTDAVVLVTGASAGIGRVAAARFAAKGAQVLVHGRDPERTQQVADAVRGRAFVADLASPADRQRLATEALKAFGHVDVLVNNAGFGYAGAITPWGSDGSGKVCRTTPGSRRLSECRVGRGVRHRLHSHVG